ncbi:hypothetical protein [Streptomyces sp. NPDC055107]
MLARGRAAHPSLLHSAVVVLVRAVATGRTTAAELADAWATITVRDLQDAAPLQDLLR